MKQLAVVSTSALVCVEHFHRHYLLELLSSSPVHPLQPLLFSHSYTTSIFSIAVITPSTTDVVHVHKNDVTLVISDSLSYLFYCAVALSFCFMVYGTTTSIINLSRN